MKPKYPLGAYVRVIDPAYTGAPDEDSYHNMRGVVIGAKIRDAYNPVIMYSIQIPLYHPINAPSGGASQRLGGGVYGFLLELPGAELKRINSL
jgi:hypothetical protein